MAQSDSNRSDRSRHRRIAAFMPAVAVLAALPAGIADGAENGEWTLLLEPMSMDAFGHDQQVLTVHEIDRDASPPADRGTPVGLDTERTFANRFGLRYRRSSWEVWAVGFDIIFFGASQGRPARSAAADGPSGPVDQVVFEAAGRQFASDDPAETVFFNVLEDTDLEVWTTDFYGIRTFAETPEGRLRLLLGLRNADFDNDYRGIQGVQDINGALIEASSNYDRMIGPLVALAGEIQLGRNTLSAYVGQSVVFGSADLGRSIGDFAGAAPDPATIVPRESFERNQDVSIPITELRMTWLHPLGQRLALGVTANASMWTDVPVPPDIVPTAGGGYNRNTIVFFGVGAAIRLTF